MRVRKNMEGFGRLRSVAEALRITSGDLAGPVLTRMGQAHRRQQSAIFASEGAVGASGPWQPLSPWYAKRKKKRHGRRKILVLSGDMRRRFTAPSSPEYIQRYIATTSTGGVFQFGAASDVAAAHLRGDPTLAPFRSESASSLFSGAATNLPVRDMISKTAPQVSELRQVLVDWYRNERVPQVLRGIEKL